MYWQTWAEQNAVAPEILETAKALVLELSLQKDGETEQEWQRLKSQLTPVVEMKTTKKSRTIWWRVAAAVALIIASIGIWKAVQPAPIEWLTYATQVGEVQQIDLADGSTIHLNANSSLEVDQELEEATIRRVRLNGEAYFDIAKRPKQAFIVETAKGEVRVLGTSFNVADRSDRFELTLVEGSIEFRVPNQPAVAMKVGDQLNIVDQKLMRQSVDTEDFAAWRDARMNFRNVTIERVIAQIEADFDWNIKVKNPKLLDRKINAQIPKNDPILLFEALAAIYDLSIEQVGDKEYILQ